MGEETHVLRGTEDISSPAEAVFKVLTDLTQHYTQFALSTTAVEVLTPAMSFGKGFKWRESRRVLYLRDECVFTVTDYDVRFHSLASVALTYGVRMEDGFNLVHYNFKVEPTGQTAARVQYCVDCRMRFQEAGSEICQPSERLARMMAKQDGLLVKRLKTHIESTLPVQCF